MKLVNRLDESSDRSLYSGKASPNVEVFLRPIPTTDQDGTPLKPSKRYYVFRLLNFQTEERDYPFIIRNEHEFYHKDASGKVIEIKRICCPTSRFAKKQINDVIDQDYCPICNFSKKQNVEAWKNWKATKQYDAMSQQLSKEAKAIWAAYIPVLVISDPAYDRNNNHLKVLRLSKEEGKSTLKRIRECINEANERGINVFNGQEGANIAILCEKQTKLMFKKDGSPVIDPKTGAQRSYVANCVTDVRLLANKLHSYSVITESEIEKLCFDDQFGTAVGKETLNAFLNGNYLDTGASDEDFSDGFTDSDFCEPAQSNIISNKSQSTNTDDNDLFSESDAIDNPIENTSPKDLISKITSKASCGSKIKIADSFEDTPNVDDLRNNTNVDIDDDLPF